MLPKEHGTSSHVEKQIQLADVFDLKLPGLIRLVLLLLESLVLVNECFFEDFEQIGQVNCFEVELQSVGHLRVHNTQVFSLNKSWVFV